jgi:hypothetical protein
VNPERSLVQPFVDAIEWEPLQHAVEGTVSRFGDAVGKFGTIVVARDAEYRLVVTVASLQGPPWTTANNGVPVGTVSQGAEVEAHEGPYLTFKLENVTVTATTSNWDHEGDGETTVDLRAHRFSRTFKATAPTLFVDWFISGPDDPYAFDRVTERNRSESFARLRRGLHADGEDHRFERAVPPPGRTSGASARDHFRMDLPTGIIRVCRVPQKRAPSWTTALAIEFPITDAEPSQDLRDGVAEALGFVFGRHILRVGSTLFDGDGYAVRQEAISPWGRDVTYAASRSDLPVTLLFDGHNRRAETIVTPIVAAFLEAREELNLSRVVWTMWIALRAPLTFDTPLYASALEALMKGWFASTRTKSSGLYMATKEFRERFGSILTKFAEIAKDVAYGDRILRRVEAANAMGVNERFQIFFEEIGLPIGDGEDAVIRSRNVGAHGGGTSQPNVADLVKLGHGYRTILNRALLKLLRFEGQYIDYSTVGHPVRRLDDPIGYRAPK